MNVHASRIQRPIWHHINRDKVNSVQEREKVVFLNVYINDPTSHFTKLPRDITDTNEGTEDFKFYGLVKMNQCKN